MVNYNLIICKGQFWDKPLSLIIKKAELQLRTPSERRIQ